jgi:para-nitrobenzyl esterase
MKTVLTKLGKIEGIQKEGYTLFKGIPYAKPPVGELRFKAPLEMEPWEGVYLANEFKNRGMQNPYSDGFYGKEFYDEPEYNIPVSEDSLYLNIWTPSKCLDEKYPVALWIHGGAFYGGYGSEKEFDGAAYCKRDVILVTINYRLGPFGFLAHPWFAEESENKVTGNYGILDQIAALKWVYNNIHAFGGNPDNITIFGQSAGSMSVQTLVSSKLTGNMIAKAIFQSAGGYNGGLNRNFQMEDALKIGEELADGCNVKSAAEFRALPAEIILERAEPIINRGFANGFELIFSPVIDGYVLNGGYDELVDKGEVKNIPYMVGSTKDDMTVTPEIIANGEYGTIYKGCCNWSLHMEGLGHKPSYVYYFTRELPGDEAGAFHSSELWYMFGTLNRCWRPFTKEDYELSEEMLDYWTNFMKKGNPNTEGMEDWAPYTAKNPFVKILDI